MRTSSTNPLPAVVPVPPLSAAALISTSTTAPPTPSTPPVAGRKNATGAQIKPSDPSQKTSLSQAALLHLPNETLMTIAGYCSDSSLKALRVVNHRLKDVAQTKTSAPQNFIFARNGPAGAGV